MLSQTQEIMLMSLILLIAAIAIWVTVRSNHRRIKRILASEQEEQEEQLSSVPSIHVCLNDAHSFLQFAENQMNSTPSNSALNNLYQDVRQARLTIEHIMEFYQTYHNFNQTQRPNTNIKYGDEQEYPKPPSNPYSHYPDELSL